METKAIEQRVTVTYACDVAKNMIKRGETLDAVFIYAAFFWPVMFAIATLVWPTLNLKLTTAILEILLCIWTGCELYILTAGETLKFGAYISSISIGAYFLVTLKELVTRVRRKWGRQTQN